MISNHRPAQLGPGATRTSAVPYRKERTYLVLALALLVGIAVYLIADQREQTWRNAESGVLNLALGLQTTSTRTLEQSLSSLRRLGAVAARETGSAREALPASAAVLREAILVDPVSAFLGVEGEDGGVVLVDRRGTAVAADVAQAVRRLVPVAHGAEPVLQSLIRLPHDEEAYLPVSLELPGGPHAGSAFALLAAHGLIAGSEGLRLVPDGWVGWILPDGTRLLFYSPIRGEMQINGPRVPAAIMQLNTGSSGFFSARGPVDGLLYLVGYSRSATLPMLVAVTVPASALYLTWARKALAPALVLLAGLAAVLIFWSRLHATLKRERLYDLQREHMLAELQELAGRLLRLQDDERRRIGRELHDSTSQLLAVLEFNLDRIAAGNPQLPPAVRTLLRECIELAHQCSSDLRTTAYLLHPPLLDELGLVSALRWLADGLRHRSEIRVELQLPEKMERLPLLYELALFRVAQEALTNVHRHSHSPSVVIRLWKGVDTVTLEVEDAGHGILDEPPGTTPPEGPASGVGLASMRVRMRQLGGTLTIDTGSEGTCVRAQLGLAVSAAEGAAPAAPPPADAPVPADSLPAMRAG